MSKSRSFFAQALVGNNPTIFSIDFTKPQITPDSTHPWHASLLHTEEALSKNWFVVNHTRVSPKKTYI